MWVLMQCSMGHSACRVPMLPAFPEELVIAQQTLHTSLTYISGRSGTLQSNSLSLLPSCRHSPRSWFWLLCGRGPLTALTHCGTQVAVEPSLLWSWRPVGKLAGEAATKARVVQLGAQAALMKMPAVRVFMVQNSCAVEARPEGLNLQLTQMTVVIMQPLQLQTYQMCSSHLSLAGTSRDCPGNLAAVNDNFRMLQKGALVSCWPLP